MAAKSDLSCLSKSQANVVQNVLEKLNLKGKEVSVEPLGKVGDNFAADVRVLTVKDDEDKELRMITKLTPNTAQNAMSALTSLLFINEIAMYTEILPTFTQLQENVGVELKNAFQFAKCYGFSSENQQEILLLEDLSKYSYTLLDKFKPLPDETMKLVLSNLADYHSLSYALKDRSPDTFKEFSKKLVDLNSIMRPEDLKGYSSLGESISQIFDKEKYKNIIKNILSVESMAKINKLRETDCGSKYTVIVHGDTWTNNILFQIKDGKTTKCVFIDYQLVRESMPVTDILYLIFNCTDYETRSKHYNDWLDYYHAQMEKSLFNFGLRINNVYPRDKLDSDMKRYAKTSLGVVVMALTILLRKSEESAAFTGAMSESKELEDMIDHLNINTLATETVSNMKERIIGLIDSCFDFGLINEL